MNRSGFTTVEVMIASVLIIALVTAGSAGLRQLNLISQIATTRTAHTEIRSRVQSVLSNTGACAGNLGNPSIVLPAGPVNPPPSFPISQLKDGAIVVLEDGKGLPGTQDSEGLIYHLALRFPTPLVSDAFAAGMGRPNPTRRYLAEFEIRGERDRLKEMGGMRGDLVSKIPLSVEVDSTNTLISCTTQPEDVDELLVPGIVQHTVRDCLRDDGFPMPTSMGLICRLAIPYQPQIAATYPTGVGIANDGIPNCSTLGNGTWRNASPFSPNYNTTLPIDIQASVCPGDPSSAVTGWHSLSKRPVEQQNMAVKKGTANTLQIVLGGTTFVALVVVAAIPVLGTIISAAVVLAAFIVSLFKKCKSENFHFYAQVTGVGCV